MNATVTPVAPPASAVPAAPGRSALSLMARVVVRVLLTVGLIVGLWWLVSFVFFRESQLIPRPQNVFSQLGHDGWSFYRPNIAATLAPALKGYFWGNLLAITLACTILLFPVFEKSLLRIAIISYCLPLIAVGPILVTVMHGDGPRFVLAALSVFFTTLIGTLLGLRQADPLSLDLVHSCGGGRLQALRKVRGRAALPSLFAALQIAAPAALLGSMLGEYLGATKGLGVALLAAQRSLQVERAWGIAIVTSLLAGIGFAITVLARHLVVRWNGDAVSVATGAREAQTARHRGALRTISAVVIATIASTAGLVLLWQLIVSYTGLDPFVAKGPGDVWRFLFDVPAAAANRSELLAGLQTTLTHAALGYMAGTVLAFVLACTFVLSRFAERTVMPMAIALQSIPIVAMVPIIAIVFGRGVLAVVIVCGAVTFFPTLVNLGVAMRQTPRPVVDVFRAYSATPRTVLWRARVPSSLPALFASARIAAPGALFGALLAEWLVTGNGLGYLMLKSGTLSRYAAVWAATLAITVVSIVFYTLVAAVERQALARFSLSGGQ